MLLHLHLLLTYPLLFFDHIAFFLVEPVLRDVVQLKLLDAVVLRFDTLSAFLDSNCYFHFGFYILLVMTHVLDSWINNWEGDANNGVGLAAFKIAVSVNFVHDYLSVVSELLGVTKVSAGLGHHNLRCLLVFEPIFKLILKLSTGLFDLLGTTIYWFVVMP